MKVFLSFFIIIITKTEQNKSLGAQQPRVDQLSEPFLLLALGFARIALLEKCGQCPRSSEFHW